MIRYPDKESMRCSVCGKLMYPVMHEETKKGKNLLICHGLRCGNCHTETKVNDKNYFVVERNHVQMIDTGEKQQKCRIA